MQQTPFGHLGTLEAYSSEGNGCQIAIAKFLDCIFLALWA